MSYGFNLARQRSTWDDGRFYHSVNEPQDLNQRQKYTETTLSFTLSIPFNWGDNPTSVAMNYNQSRANRSSTLSMNGTRGEQNELSWSVYGGYDRYRNGDEGTATTFGGNVQQNTRFGALRVGYDQGKDYRQVALGSSAGFVVLILATV